MTFEVETFYNFDTIKSFGISSLYGKKMRNWQEKFKDISLKYNMFYDQDEYRYVDHRNGCSVCSIWILSVPALDKRYFLWNDDFIFTTEK